jgi:hypothetical protein
LAWELLHVRAGQNRQQNRLQIPAGEAGNIRCDGYRQAGNRRTAKD